MRKMIFTAILGIQSMALPVGYCYDMYDGPKLVYVSESYLGDEHFFLFMDKANLTYVVFVVKDENNECNFTEAREGEVVPFDIAVQAFPQLENIPNLYGY